MSEFRELFEEIPALLLRNLAAAPIIPESAIDGYVASNGSSDLTEPELHALLLMSHGLEEQMAADMLGKSLYTVKYQLKSARYKLKAKNTRHAIAIALRMGLID